MSPADPGHRIEVRLDDLLAIRGLTLVDLADHVGVTVANLSTLKWNGERLFQAAKFGTEMQYQHLVFEEFARTIQPNIDVFIDYQVAVNPSIVAEFAHTVYRFGP